MDNMMATLLSALNRPTLDALNSSDLPKQEMLALLQIWASGSRKHLRALVKANELLPVLKRQYRKPLEEANRQRLSNPHLTITECLQVAGIPLTL
jgi:hypothetical protein